jgi:hypothetical protein
MRGWETDNLFSAEKCLNKSATRVLILAGIDSVGMIIWVWSVGVEGVLEAAETLDCSRWKSSIGFDWRRVGSDLQCWQTFDSFSIFGKNPKSGLASPSSKSSRRAWPQ